MTKAASAAASDSPTAPPPSRASPSTRWSMIDTMLASAAAGMAARVPLHPLDTLKAKLQVQQQFRAGLLGVSGTAAAAAAAHVPSAAALPVQPAASSSPSPRSLLALARHTVRAEGVRGLYAGFGVTFFGSAPAACLYFTTYETCKSALTSSPTILSSSPFLAHFASGLLAEAAACILWVPVDVVKERLQVQQQLKELMQASAARGASATATAAAVTGAPLPSSLGPLLPAAAAVPPASLYRGNWDAILTIARTEGVRGVYRGYGATLASFGPFSAIYFSGYEQCKRVLGEYVQRRTVNPAAKAAAEPDLGFLGFALCGGVAGSVATIVTNPLDLVKLRMQVQRGNSGLQFGYKNVLHGLQTLVAQEGPQALFKGAAVRCMFHIPSTAITIAIVDSLRRQITQIRTAITE